MYPFLPVPGKTGQTGKQCSWDVLLIRKKARRVESISRSLAEKAALFFIFFIMVLSFPFGSRCLGKNTGGLAYRMNYREMEKTFNQQDHSDCAENEQLSQNCSESEQKDEN